MWSWLISFSVFNNELTPMPLTPVQHIPPSPSFPEENLYLSSSRVRTIAPKYINIFTHLLITPINKFKFSSTK